VLSARGRCFYSPPTDAAGRTTVWLTQLARSIARVWLGSGRAKRMACRVCTVSNHWFMHASMERGPGAMIDAAPSGYCFLFFACYGRLIWLVN